MTPFDPVALVVMLQTFYPLVARGSIEHARGERPEYFAGGDLYGSEKLLLLLPDGRVWFLTTNGWNAGSQWQLVEHHYEPGGTLDPLALEEGPLLTLDAYDFQFTPSSQSFVPLAAQLASDLGAHDDAAGVHATTIAEGADPTAFDDVSGRAIDDVATGQADAATALAGIDVGDVLDQHDAAVTGLDGPIADWDAQDIQIVPTMPTVPGTGVKPPYDPDDPGDRQPPLI